MTITDSQVGQEEANDPVWYSKLPALRIEAKTNPFAEILGGTLNGKVEGTDLLGLDYLDLGLGSTAVITAVEAPDSDIEALSRVEVFWGRGIMAAEPSIRASRDLLASSLFVATRSLGPEANVEYRGQGGQIDAARADLSIVAEQDLVQQVTDSLSVLGAFTIEQ